MRAAGTARVVSLALVAGCGHVARTPAASTPPPALLLASRAPGLRLSLPVDERSGLVVTMSVCWYPASSAATATEPAPRLDPRRCRTVAERVVVDGADAATLDRVERLTIEDVALKLERGSSGDDTN